MMKVWILTFNRPAVLNRQIETFGKLGYDVHIFSNHPQVGLLEENKQYIKEIVFNNLSDEEANSYCARSWNNIFIKAFKDGECPSASEEDVKQVLTLIDKLDPSEHEQDVPVISIDNDGRETELLRNVQVMQENTEIAMIKKYAGITK